MEEMARLGELIRSTREIRGMDAKVLASRVGMNPGSLSNLERGLMKNTPDPHTLRGISEALGIPTEKMLETLGYLDSGKDEAENEAVSAVRAILEGRDFTDDQINHIVTILRAVVGAMESS